ncbi:putative DNA replication factor C subunit [Cafeteria roenbergensis virus]|uniref:Putative DNA replication factor C subunit n=1 Tax=Cafeteria roenbergensis virus (strain BV-PW1) TaxID=693272 RepID=E3T5A0_CROVB|nr:putative DNA replication factor C subunit [Cafeteria roenbergensis virus BV-PW1]ADO67363.1 putative DNA replication factor C subunit [Cafeteria roenbergensis virus BV-PW1]
MAFSKETKEKINDLIFENYNFDEKNENIIIYGLEEYCEEYFIRKLLEKIYGEISIIKENYELENYNKTIIEIKKSDNHIEFNPLNSGSDRYALSSLMDDFGSNPMINMVIKGTKNNKRTIIINKIDYLNYYCQASLRRNMEKYSHVTNFILICQNLSKITEPIRSRCSLITMENFNKNKILKQVLPNFEEDDTDNLSELILSNELKRLNLGEVKNLKNYINRIFNLHKLCFNDELIRKLKLLIYNIYISNYNLDDILIELNNYIMKLDIKIDLKYLILKEILKTNHNLNLGKRYLIHFENLFIKIFHILTINKIII